MNIKKQAIEELMFYLERTKNNLESQKRSNKYDMNRLAEEQRKVKIKINEVNKLINELRGK